MRMCLVLALPLLLLFVAPAHGAEDSLAIRLRGRAFSTGYLDVPLLGARQVSLQGTPDRFEAKLDPNTCQLDMFGDPSACTRMAVRTLGLRVLRYRAADPTMGDRRLLGLVPEGKVAWQLHLVLPAVGREGARLLFRESEAGPVRVVPLQASPVTAAPPARDAALGVLVPFPVSYDATQQGETLTVIAEGDAPTPGFELALRYHQIWSAPLQWRFFGKRPRGLVPQVLTPFEVRSTYPHKATSPVKEIVVVDGRGEHRVVVRQLPAK